MAKYSGYVYVLSNPAMPGVVKIGKTTTSVQQRMRELNTTGIPTPFELELSIHVENCHDAELRSHRALKHCRKNSGREFFKISPKNAITTILEIILVYKIIDFKENLGIHQIEAEIKRRQHAKNEEEKKKLEAKAKFAAAEKKLQNNKIKNTVIRIQHLKHEIINLGTRPLKKDPDKLLKFFQSLYEIPFGFFLFLGAFLVFLTNWYALGLICISLLLIGHYCDELIEKENKEFNDACRPYINLEKEICDLEAELKSYGYTPQEAPNSSKNNHSGAYQPRDAVKTDSRGFEKQARIDGRRAVQSRGAVKTDNRGFEKPAQKVGRRASD
jgi:hypothetical protein